MKINRIQIAFLCFISDCSLSLWSFFRVKNYDQYLKIAHPIINSPELEEQIFSLFIQSLIFAMILFLLFHLVIYILLVKEKKSALKYVQFYSFMATLSAVIMIFYGAFIGILPLASYGLSFYSSRKLLAEMK